MNSQELRNLSEAYLEVYSDLEEGAAEVVVKAADWVRKGPRRHAQAMAQHQEKKRQEKIPYKALHAEEVDIYDIILSHLLDEGYAETQEAANVIMVNMSEEWRESIVEGFKPIGKDTENRMYRRAGNLARTSIASDNPKEKIASAKKSAKIVSTIVRQKERDRFDSIGQDPKHN